jgi:acetyl esterase
VVANRPVVPVCFQALVYPCTDARMGSRSYAEIGEGYNLTRSGMAWFYDRYLSGPDGSADDPLVSPLLEDDARLASVPSAIVVTAEYDPLRDDGEAYAARLADAGVATSLVRFAGQVHGFFSMFGLVDDCRNAQALVAEAVHNAFLRSGQDA